MRGRDDVLEIDRVSKRYGDVVALDDMAFTVRAGEMFGFVGSNGAGKTTTMRIALGVLAADSGTVRWNGAPLNRESRRHIGYMPEQRGLYPKMRVDEQLAYFGQLHGMSRSAARTATELWCDRLDLGTLRDRALDKLSLGNQQRVQLAAALVHEPGVLVLDEPFSGLDPVAVELMSAVLRERCDNGVPVVFSSHQLDLVQRLCDRVGIVSDGRMVASGTVDELRAAGPVRLVVRAPNAATGWADGVDGAEVLGTEHGRITVELAEGADDQQVLQAALATGPVHEFSRQRPHLTELFHDVVLQERAA